MLRTFSRVAPFLLLIALIASGVALFRSGQLTAKLAGEQWVGAFHRGAAGGGRCPGQQFQPISVLWRSRSHAPLHQGWAERSWKCLSRWAIWLRRGRSFSS